LERCNTAYQAAQKSFNEATQKALNATAQAPQQRNPRKRSLYNSEQDITTDKPKKKLKGEVVQQDLQPHGVRNLSQYSGSEARTAFVVNLPFSVDEQELKQMFSKFGEVKEVRLVRDAGSQKSKGFAYVEFLSEESATASLALDKSDLKGRRLKVSISSPPSSKLVRDYSDKLTLFVSNLPTSTTKEELEDIFKSAGAIKDVRIVRDKKDNSPKGFAYVEFADEESLNSALTLSREIQGVPLSVARSAPPAKLHQQRTPFAYHDAGYQVVSKTEVKGPSSTPRSRASLMPRALRPTQSPQKPMSNDEFRKQLLGK